MERETGNKFTFYFTVKGMTCAGCAGRLEKVLNRLEDVQASVVFATQTARITLFGETQNEQICAQQLKKIFQAVKAAGFEAVFEKCTFNINNFPSVPDSEKLREKLSACLGVENIEFNKEQITIAYIPSIINVRYLLNILEEMGCHVSINEKNERADEGHKEETLYKRQLRHCVVALIIALPFAAHMLGMFVPAFSFTFPVALQAFLAFIIQFYCARQIYMNAWHAVLNKTATMDVLVGLGAAIAFLYSVVVAALPIKAPVYFESSVFIIAFVLIGRLLEGRARQNTQKGLDSLRHLQPRTALILRGNEFIKENIDLIRPGDICRVLPSSYIAVDGALVKGASDVDEALLTGESKPVFKRKGDEVYAGTVNLTSPLEIKVQKLREATVLSSIISMVKQAQTQKAPIQRYADRVASYFVPFVLTIAFLSFLIHFACGHSLSYSLVTAVSVLVVACPCALGLATPTAILVGTALGAKLGILFRNAVILEKVHKLTVLALDKTGTLTRGEFVLEKIMCSEDKHREILSLLVASERQSQHPLARAVIDYGKKFSLTDVKLSNVKTIPGYGLEASIADPQGSKKKQTVLCGSYALMDKRNVAFDRQAHPSWLREGFSVLYLAVNGRVVCVCALADKPRHNARAIVQMLRRHGVSTFMLTGDTRQSAQLVGRDVGLPEQHVFAEQTPQSKAKHISSFHEGGKQCVGMVGDGINDAPALACSDVSFALSEGSDVAINQSDVILMHDDLQALPCSIALSRATMAKIRQNLFFAFIYNILGIPLAFMGVLNPSLAAALMSLSSVSVVTNSVLLSRWRFQSK